MKKLIVLGILLLIKVFILIKGYLTYKGVRDGKNDIFYMASIYLHKQWIIHWPFQRKESTLSTDVRETLRLLHPGEYVEAIKTEYFVGKIRLVFIILLSGNILAFAVCLSGITNNELLEGNIIERNTYDQPDKKTTVHVESEGLPFEEDIEITIESMIYTEEEINNLYEKAVNILPSVIFSEGDTCDSVRNDLNLATNIEGYPFSMAWSSSNCDYLDAGGRIVTEDIPEEGIPITLNCTFKYGDWKNDFQFLVMIYPPIFTEEEIWKKAVSEGISLAKEETKYSRNLVLPKVADDTDLIWTEKKDDSSIALFALFAMSSGVLFFAKDYDLLKKKQERRKEIEEDYCAIVSKLTLFMAAGMTSKSAFQKIVDEYKRNRRNHSKRYVYEEMILACNEMSNGVSEAKAYERFAIRCGSGTYTRLVGLLCQNIKKGNAKLLSEMKEESFRAQTERQNNIRKKGEEAGTKLLVPMMMMLGIVLIIIMAPAFISFSV